MIQPLPLLSQYTVKLMRNFLIPKHNLRHIYTLSRHSLFDGRR